MAFISYALTVNEFLAGKKTCTRRDWSDHHFKQWCKYWDEGKHVHDAWNKVPYAGGKKIGKFRLTCRPYKEKLADMPVEDLAAEGGMCATFYEFYELIKKGPEDTVVVIRFLKENPQ